jgi:uncharacterized repeat protein (TIGR01451 family)
MDGSKRGFRGQTAFLVVLLACAVALVAPAVGHAGGSNANCVITQSNSINSDAASDINFDNESGVPVDVYWLDFPVGATPTSTGGRVFYFSLADGTSFDQPTFITHPWVAIDPATGACLGYTISDVPSKTYVIKPPPPVELSDPSISGTPIVGGTLSVLQGTYGEAITAFTYQWDRCTGSACAPIDGATGSTYTPTTADDGDFLRVREFATNLAGGTSVAPSALVGPLPLSADLAATLKCETNCVAAPNDKVTFTGAVKNNGPDPASGAIAVLTMSFSGVWTLDSATAGGVECGTIDLLSCGLGTVAPGASVPVTLTVIVNSVVEPPETLTAMIHVQSEVTDPNSDNSFASADATVIGSHPVASDVSITIKPNKSEPGAREIPTANIDLAALPTTPGSTASSPIASIPIASIPIASIPIASIPIASIGLTASLLDGIGGVPLSTIPLHTPGGWDARLVGTPLEGSLLQVTTLADVFRQAPTALAGLELQDVGVASSPIASIPIASIALGPLHLSQLPLLGHTAGQNLADWCTALATAGFGCTANALADGTSVGDATMASIGIEGAPIASIPIASIPIASIPIASIPIASIPIASIAVAGSPIASIPIASIAVAGSPIASIPIASIPIASIDAVVDCSGGYVCTGKTLGDAARDGRIPPGAKLSDLPQAILDSITLGELGPFFPPDITLGDVLAILAGPASVRNYELLPFTQLPAQDWATGGGKAIYHVGFAITGGPATGGASVVMTLPAGFRYAGAASLAEFNDGALVSSSAPDPPVVSSSSVSFHLDGLTAGHTFRLDFNLRPSLILGAAGPPTATVTPENGGTPASATEGDLEITDTFEPENNDAPNAPLLSADTVYLSYVTSATDTDTYRIPAPPAGSHVTVKLVPPAGADYDLSLYRPSPASVLGSTAPSPPLDGQPVPDQGVPLTHSTSSQAPETLADIPIASIPIASISDNRGSAEEVASAVTQPGDAGQFLRVDVSGYQGSTSTKPYTLLVTVTPPPDLGSCDPSPIVTTGLSPLGTLATPSSTSPALNTLFVVDSRRLQAAYGVDDAQTAISSLSTLAGRTDLGVNGAVLDVANDPAVAAAEATWDASPCSPDNANAVATAIAAAVARYTAVRPSVKYIVLGGGDDQIPFFRLSDLTTVSNEADYASTFIDHPNQYFGPLASGDVLSDNPYGTAAPTPFFDRYLYVPSRSVGRLVETADDIVAAVTQFTSNNGALNPSTGLVTGYDFLADGSHDVAATETALHGGANLATLIDDPGSTSAPWSAASLDSALGTSPASVLSLNAHYDHYRLLPSDRGTLFTSAQMAAKALDDRFVFTMGCHAGLSVSDIVVGAADTRRLDWAQVYGAGGALFAGNTGFGYGDTTGVAYSEKLMSFLAKRMDGTVTAGDALMFAKNDFKSSLGPLDVYDEKVMSEATFYGLPMYRVGPTVALPPAPAPRPTAPDALVGGSVVAADLTVSPTLTQKSSPFGSYYASTDTISTSYRPVEPSTSTDVTEPGLVAHGAVITQLASTDFGDFDAAFSMPTIDRTATATEPVFRDAVFPTKIQTVQSYLDPRGQRQRLVLVVGQFASDPAAAAGHGRQRNFTQVGARVYYAPPSVSDYTPAQFGLVEGAQLGTQASFSVRASDTGGTGVKRVLVGYHDGPTWKFVDLLQSSTDPTAWTGGGPTSTTNPEFFVQAVDGGGNVSVTSYKGRYYLAPPAPSPGGGISWTFTGTLGDNGWFRSDVTAEVTAPAGTELGLDGGPFTLKSPVAITGTGVHLLGIRLQDTVTNVPVGIDAAAPTIVVSSPVDGAVLTAGDGTRLGFVCADEGSGVASCTATLDGSPIANGADVSTKVGSRTLVVTAKDGAGNSTSKTLTFAVHWTFSGFFNPVNNPPTLNVVKPGQAVPVRFGLGGNQGLAIFAAGYPVVATIACSASAPTDPVEQTVTAGNSSLQYDAGSNQYTYVWKTPSAGWPAGACRQLVMKLVDGTTHVANFKAK